MTEKCDGDWHNNECKDTGTEWDHDVETLIEPQLSGSEDEAQGFNGRTVVGLGGEGQETFGRAGLIVGRHTHHVPCRGVQVYPVGRLCE